METIFIHLASLLKEKKSASLFVIYSEYSSQINADGLILLCDKLYIISDWKSNFKYAAIILERFLYSFPYKKIQNQNNGDISLLKKETRHFFYEKNRYKTEKEKIMEFFQKVKR